MFLTILDLCSSIVLTFSITSYLKCLLDIGLLNLNDPKPGLLGIINIFYVSVERNNFVSTPDRWQLKPLLTIDER